MTAEVGILFVHGIGNQVRGETLVSFGDPIFQAVRDRIDSVPPSNSDVIDSGLTESERYDAKRTDKVQLIDASLSPSVSTPSAQIEPAYTRFTIASDEPDGSPAEWIMAECHWAASFPPPPPRAVTQWIMEVLPWLCISFFTRRIMNVVGEIKSGSPVNRFVSLVRLVIITLLALALPIISPAVLLLELFLLFLLIADLLPFKTIKEAITSLNAAISSIIGDSFIFTSSPFRQQSVIAKLLHDLEWLQETFSCKRVAIIAHSQGAAVAYLALRQLRHTEVNLLVTFGPGLVKLLQLTDRARRTVIKWTARFAAIAAAIEIVAVADFAGFDFFGWGLPGLIVIPIVAVLALIALALIHNEENTAEIHAQASTFANDGLKWIDLYAEMDPVPNGPIFLPERRRQTGALPEQPDLESVEICNQSSVISDHTSYMNNRDEFVPLIVDAIADLGGSNGQLRRRTAVERTAARGFRRFRVRSELIDHIIIFIALIAFLLDEEMVTWLGTHVSQFIHAGCSVAGASNECWTYSVTNTGRGAALLIYLLLRECFEGMSSINEDAKLNSVGLSGFISHLSACVILSFALLGHFGIFNWAKYLATKYPDFSAQYFQVGVLGGALGFIVLMYFNVRMEMFRSKLWELAGGRNVDKKLKR